MAKTDDMSTGVKVAWIGVAGTVLAAIVAGVFGYLKTDVPKPLAFRGRVTDMNTRSPLRSAKVTCDSTNIPQITYSDSEGFFTFPLDNTSQDVHIIVEAQNYDLFERRISRSNRVETEDVRLNLAQPDNLASSVASKPEHEPKAVPPGTVPSKSEGRTEVLNLVRDPKLPDWLVKSSQWLWEVNSTRAHDSGGCTDTQHKKFWSLGPKTGILIHEDSLYGGGSEMAGAPCNAYSECYYHYHVSFKVSEDGTSVDFLADSPDSSQNNSYRAPSCEDRGFFAPFSGVIRKVSDMRIKLSLSQGSGIKLSGDGGDIILSQKQ